MAIRRLHGKRVLITAGPTWVAIDDVRVISNISSGETGRILASEFLRAGASVQLLMGGVPVKDVPAIKHFRYFEELRDALNKMLKTQRFDIVVHAAAVSDFAPTRYRGKIGSDKKLTLRLRPLPKLTSLIRRLIPEGVLVIFKLEPGLSDRALVREARRAQEKSRADMVVANRLEPYKAFVIAPGAMRPCATKQAMARALVRMIPR